VFLVSAVAEHVLMDNPQTALHVVMDFTVLQECAFRVHPNVKAVLLVGAYNAIPDIL
jgi:hypothetical protein